MWCPTNLESRAGGMRTPGEEHRGEPKLVDLHIYGLRNIGDARSRRYMPRKLCVFEAMSLGAELDEGAQKRGKQQEYSGHAETLITKHMLLPPSSYLRDTHSSKDFQQR